MALIKILLVDDHELVRTGIRRLLADEEGIKVIAEASSGEEAIKLTRELQPDVILMDVRMPGIGGLEATRKLLRMMPDIRVVAVTTYGEEPFPSKLLQAGASGYITKGAGSEEMVRAIRAVFSGQRYLAQDVAHELALRHVTDKDPNPFDALSERELQIMLMITSGVRVQEISDKLCLSPKTVNSYRYRLFDKLQVNSDVELTHMAIRHKMVEMQ